MHYAAIVAGGTGSRMGSDIPKQFLPLGGVPVLVRTIERFLDSPMIDIVYVGVHKDWVCELEKMCAGAELDMSRIHITPGGDTRDATVRLIIERISAESGLTDGDVLVTHDGVRPFVSEREIEDSVRALDSCEGCTLCLPSTDTLLYSENGDVIDNVPDRSKLFRALTPQTFRLKALISAYSSLSDEQCAAVTDTAGVFILAGKPVKLVKGSPQNIKLTTPEDMRLAELLLKEEDNG